jgi:hypothetical protein
MQPPSKCHFPMPFTIPSLDPQYYQKGRCQEKKVCVMHHIYSNAKWGFSLKPGTLICEVVLFCIWSAEPHHAEMDHGKPNHSETDHVEPNHGLHHQIMNFCSPLSSNRSIIHCTCLHSTHRDNFPVLHNYNNLRTVYFCITAIWGWKESPTLS